MRSLLLHVSLILCLMSFSVYSRLRLRKKLKDTRAQKRDMNPILKKFLTDQNDEHDNENTNDNGNHQSSNDERYNTKEENSSNKENHSRRKEEKDEMEGEYNVTKTYDVINKFHKNKHKKYHKHHKHHHVNFYKKNDDKILKFASSNGDSDEAGNMFMSTEPLGTPVGEVHSLNPAIDSHFLAGADFQPNEEPESDEIPIGPLQNLQNGDFTIGGMHHHEKWQHNLHPHQNNFHGHSRHIFQPGVDFRTEPGMDHGGYLQKEPIILKAHGTRHIHRKPIHLADPHSDTSYETHIEHGHIHDHHCENGGLYFAMSSAEYQCICPETHFGKTCNQRDYCHPNPCKSDGACHVIPDIDPFYKCSCKRGFYGPLCENKDPCYPSPCRNHGVCTHDGSTATCVCATRFRGDHCELINNCAPNPCKNAGTCVEDKGDGKFHCQCLISWKGTICDQHSYCHINPCKNGGTCHEGENKFECACTNGFSGQACTDRVCQPNPCLNGGTCIEDGDKFKCVCLPWTSGDLCEEIRPCLTKPCMHDGRCIDAYSGFHWSFGPLQYYCICKPPYKGMNCEQHACKNCHKNAICQIDHCVCDEGYEGNGEVCKKTENPCHPNPCFNKGVCTEAGEGCAGPQCGFKCSCPAPFIPPLCKEKNPCQPDPCENGECVVRVDNTFQCNCEYGFRGHTCNDKDGCAPSPCQHKGSCKSINGTATCTCLGEWKPPLCKECGCRQANIKGVPNLSCSYEGQCTCPPGYTVDKRKGECQAKKKEHTSLCSPNNPCDNGGTCIDVNEKEYRCICPAGFTGKACQFHIICNPGPCLNGGTCLEKDGKFLGCQCRSGFMKPLCDKPEDKIISKPGLCKPNPCRNDGVCVAISGGYDCICSARFTGPHCDIDRCRDCDQHAKCINGHCKCNIGYIGTGYQCEKETCEVKCVQWSTCVDGQCLCNPGYTKVHHDCVPVISIPNFYEDDYDDDDNKDGKNIKEEGYGKVKTTRKPIHPTIPRDVTTTLGRVKTNEPITTTVRPTTTVKVTDGPIPSAGTTTTKIPGKPSAPPTSGGGPPGTPPSGGPPGVNPDNRSLKDDNELQYQYLYPSVH